MIIYQLKKPKNITDLEADKASMLLSMGKYKRKSVTEVIILMRQKQRKISDYIEDK